MSTDKKPRFEFNVVESYPAGRPLHGSNQSTWPKPTHVPISVSLSEMWPSGKEAQHPVAGHRRQLVETSELELRDDALREERAASLPGTEVPFEEPSYGETEGKEEPVHVAS